MDERKTDSRREVKIYPLLLLAFAALCFGEGFVYAYIHYLLPQNTVLIHRAFEWELVSYFAFANIFCALVALISLKCYSSAVRITKSEAAPARKLLIAMAPVLPVLICGIAVSRGVMPFITIIYIPALTYSVVSGMAGKRDFSLSTIAPVAFLAALVVCEIVLFMNSEMITGGFLPVFCLNCFFLRYVQSRKRDTILVNRKVVLWGQIAVVAVAALSVVFIAVNYAILTHRKIHAPVEWMGYTPDWSPQSNRIVFSAFNLKTAFALGEPVGMALIYDADARKVEKVISLPGLPSKEKIFEILNFVASPVVWTWEKDKLFYLKNGNEGVLFNADGTGFETIFKLPKNQFAQSSLLISPKRTKIYIIAKERIARPGGGKKFKLETVEHPYIIDLVIKKLSPFTIKGLQPIKGATTSNPEESICCGYLFNIALYARDMLRPPAPLSPPPFGKGCYSLLRYSYTGWFSEDILALEMPDCAARLPINLMEKFVWNGKNEDISKSTPLPYAKILVRTDGTGLGNFPPFQSTYSPMIGDGSHFLYLDSESSNTEDCIYVGNIVKKTVEKTCCITKPIGGKWKDAHGIKLNYQARAVYDASDLIWVRIYNASTDEHQPRLFNYKTCEVNPYFTPSVVGSYLSLVGMPSATGKYHVLSKTERDINSSYKDDFNEDALKYKYIFDYAFFYGYFGGTNLTDSRSFSIFTTKGKLVGSISEKDFKF